MDIGIGGNAGGGAEFTFGYSDRDIAIVSVTVEQADGTRTQLEATVDQQFPSGDRGTDKDAELSRGDVRKLRVELNRLARKYEEFGAAVSATMSGPPDSSCSF